MNNLSYSKKRKYLFIDGAYFEKAVDSISKSVGFNDLIPIDYYRISSEFERVIYYDALPVRRPNQIETKYTEEFKKKNDFLNSLKKIPGFHVKDGVTRIRDNKNGPAIEQKGVDTWLAIDVLQYAFRGIIDTAEIITGDLDLYPLFETLIQTNTRGVLHYQQKHASDELIMAADESRRLNYIQLLKWSNWEFQVENHPYYSNRPNEPFSWISKKSILDVKEIEKIETKFGIYSIGTDKNKKNWQASSNGSFIIAKNHLLLMEYIREITNDYSLPDLNVSDLN